MELLYAKRFSKDIDAIRKEARIKKALLEMIEKIREAGSLAEVRGVKEIEGYQEYYRIKLGDYRLGVKMRRNRIELIRFLHRKDIYRRFP